MNNLDQVLVLRQRVEPKEEEEVAQESGVGSMEEMLGHALGGGLGSRVGVRQREMQGASRGPWESTTQG